MAHGQLGDVEIVLPAWVDGEDRYRRTYLPVTPASRVVAGSDTQIAPETDIATWSVNDWSSGEGDVRWKDRGRYRVSSGVSPVSDGSGVTVGFDWDATSGQAAVIVRGGGRLVAARDADDNLYEWNGTAWDTLWAIGGSSGDTVVSMAATDDAAWFVLNDNGDLRKVTSAGSTAHYPSAGFTDIVAYEGVLYGLAGVDLYEINQVTASTRTLVSDTDAAFVTDTRVKLVSTSDVGVVWVSPTDDGVTLLKEYNFADDVAYTIGELPRDVHAYDVAFHAGIYLVAFRYADSHTSTGDAFLYYQIGDIRGVAGAFRADSATSSCRIAVAGVIGDRIMVSFQERLWAYDLSSGGISLTADWGSSSIGDGLGAVTFGSEVFVAGSTHYGVFDSGGFLPNVAQTLSSGLGDYGYLGLPKMVHTVTVSTEDTLAGSDTVEVGYSVDGGAVSWLADSFTSGASYQWTVSTSSSSVVGTEIEWHLRLTTTSSSEAAKIVSLVSDVSGARSRVEWQIAVDVGESSISDGGDVIAALNSLKTSHEVVEWSDPYQVGVYSAPETFDVRVKDVSTPELRDDGFLIAFVRFQTVSVVG